MPFDRTKKRFAVTITIGSETTWHGSENALMDYDTGFSTLCALSREHLGTRPGVDITITLWRRTPTRWIKSFRAAQEYPKPRPRKVRTQKIVIAV